MIDFICGVGAATVFWTTGIMFVSAAPPKTVREFLVRAGYAVVMAGSGAATLSAITGAIPDVWWWPLLAVAAAILSLNKFDEEIGIADHLRKIWVQFATIPQGIAQWWEDKLEQARRAQGNRK